MELYFKQPVAVFYRALVLMRQYPAPQSVRHLHGCKLGTQMPGLLLRCREGQCRGLFHALHGLIGTPPVQMVLIFLEQTGEFLVQVLGLQTATQLTDAQTDGDGGGKLWMFLSGFGRQTMGGFQILVPVLIFRKEGSRLRVSLVSEDFRQPSNRLYPGFIVVSANEYFLERWVLLQHPEHGVFSGTAASLGTCSP